MPDPNVAPSEPAPDAIEAAVGDLLPWFVALPNQDDATRRIVVDRDRARSYLRAWLARHWPSPVQQDAEATVDWLRVQAGKITGYSARWPHVGPHDGYYVRRDDLPAKYANEMSRALRSGGANNEETKPNG